MGIKWTCVALAPLLGLATDAGAGTELKGLAQAHLRVRLAESSKQACGLSEDALTPALKLPIGAYTRIKAQNKPEDVLITVSVESIPVTTGPRSIGCAHTVRLEAIWIGIARLENTTVADGIHEVMLWRDSFIALSPTNESPRHVREMVEEMARKFASAWQEANR
jgi:hypothetical protein